MIKQQQRVIKKGEYYEIETYEQTMMLISKSKKQQSQQQTSSSGNIPLSEHILTEVPSWGQARSKYYTTGTLLKKQFENKGFYDLVEELAKILKDEEQEDRLRDEDRKEIETLMQEISSFANCKESDITHLNLQPTHTQPQQQAKGPQPATNHPTYSAINLTTKYNISQISSRISQLQSLDFPDLISLQHQLEIMLGEKKPLQSLQLSHMDEKEKEELNNLYNHLNSLSIMNNTQRVIESVSMNEAKHVEMLGWVNKMETVQSLNVDLLDQLKQDQGILERLEKNFAENVKQVREIVSELKNEKL